MHIRIQDQGLDEHALLTLKTEKENKKKKLKSNFSLLNTFTLPKKSV